MAKMEWTTDRRFIQPNWAAEAIGPHQMIPGGARLDPAQFPHSDAFTVTLTAGVITAGAGRTLTLTTGLREDIPADYTLDFGAGETFRLTSRALKGATTLVGTLAADLEGGESALYGGVTGKKLVQAGTLVGRTFAERDAGVPFGVAVSTDEEIYLLAFDTPDAIANPECDLLRHNVLVRDHLLPGWAGLSADLRSRIRSLYGAVRGFSNI